MKKLLLLAAVALLAAAPAKAATLGPDLATNGLTYDFSIIGGSLELDVRYVRRSHHRHQCCRHRCDWRTQRHQCLCLHHGEPPQHSVRKHHARRCAFQSGGLNSGGCNGSGGFFCFGNTNVADTPALASGTVIDIDFTLTLASGNFLSWDPSFKIDWNGSQNNYSLVSEVIPLGPNGTPFGSPPGETPLPAAVWLFGTVAGAGGLLLRRRKRAAAVAHG